MSAGFDLDGEVFWGSNGSIEVYVETLGAIAAKAFGPDDRLAQFFQSELEVFSPGRVVFLDDCLDSAETRKRFVQVLDDATRELLSGDAFSESGRSWVAAVISELRAKLVRNL